MSNLKKKKPTLKQQLEELQARFSTLGEREMVERQQRCAAESKIRDLENKLQFTQAHAESLKANVRDLEIQLAEEDARAEAFEFVLRMQNKYPVVEVGGEKKQMPFGVDRASDSPEYFAQVMGRR